MTRGSWFPRSAPDTSVRPDNWRDHAECRDEDPELFFPIGNTGPALLQIEDAKKVCRHCTVRAECFHFAVTEPGIEAGVWGGLSEDELREERRAIKRRRAAPNKAQQSGKR